LQSILGFSGFCVALESVFLHQLENTTYVDKITVRGSIPPSWLVHLLKPSDDGFSLKLNYMSEGLCNYIKDRPVMEEGWGAAPLEPGAPHPVKMAYPQQGTVATLVHASRGRKMVSL